MVEVLATGHVETFSGYGLAETLVSLVVLFWWYHLDKAEQNAAYLRELGEARSAASAATNRGDPTGGDPVRKASASLPQPTYQLGGPRAAPPE